MLRFGDAVLGPPRRRIGARGIPAKVPMCSERWQLMPAWGRTFLGIQRILSVAGCRETPMSQPMTGEAPRAGSRRRSILLVVVGPVVLILAVAGWVWTSAEQRDDVAVSLSSPPRCPDTGLAWRRVGVGHRVPAMRVQEPMDCRSLLRVSNHGRWPVRVTEVVMPLMGPYAGEPFDIEQVNGVRPVAGTTGGLAAALFRVDRRLAA